VYNPRDGKTYRMVARELGISVRSLRRHVLDEGASFPRLAGATAFHHAFKRWAGLTPSEYRAREAWTTVEALTA
jgi:AraC-like DNA-binding protein